MQISQMKRKEWNIKFKGSALIASFVVCFLQPPFFPPPQKMSENPDNSNVVFLKVDVDEAQDVATFCDIKCMPTFHFYKNGKKIDEFSESNHAKLEEKIKMHKWKTNKQTQTHKPTTVITNIHRRNIILNF